MGYQCNEHALYIDKDYIEEQTFDKMKQFFLTLQEKEMDRLFERYYKENVQKAKKLNAVPSPRNPTGLVAWGPGAVR